MTCASFSFALLLLVGVVVPSSSSLSFSPTSTVQVSATPTLDRITWNSGGHSDSGLGAVYYIEFDQSASIDPTNPIPTYASDPDAPIPTLTPISTSNDDTSSVLHVYYSEQWQKTGSSYLQIVTNETWSSRQQAYYAGYAEGYLAAGLMSAWWSKDIIYPDPTVVPAEKAWVKQNLEYMQSQIAEYNTTDSWWFQAQLLIDQIQGLTDGYAATNPTTPMSFDDVYWSSLSAGDLDDLPCVVNVSSSACVYIYSPPPPQPHLNLTSDQIRIDAQAQTGIHRRIRPAPFSHCSGFVKFADDKSDLFVGHAVWDDYNSMIRIVKHYTFNFRTTAADSAPLIATPGHLFSSYPGVLLSGDDFWITSSGLVLISSEIGPVPDATLYAAANIQPDNSRFEFFRQTIAARLTTNAVDYAQMWSVSNSGTFNSEWLVVDYAGFEAGKELAKNTVFYMAQIPGSIVAYDITSTVNQIGFAGTFNIPADSTIYNNSGWPAMYAEKAGTRFGTAYADLFTHDHNPRYKIALRDHKKIVDLPSFQTFLRYNQYQTDKLSAGPGTPPHSPWHAICARADLVDQSSTADYPDELQADCFGGNDGKAVSSSLVSKMNLVSIVGPTADDQSVFSFSANAGTNGLCAEQKYPHAGLPDKWQFDWTQTNWPIQREGEKSRTVVEI